MGHWLPLGVVLLGGELASDPTQIQDVFFGIGGTGAGKASTSLIVNSAHVLLDDI